MSASIRKSLPSLIHGLSNHLSKARDFINKNSVHSLPDGKAECITVLSSAELFRANLEMARDKILAKDSAWELILGQTDGDADELKRYEDFAYNGTGNLQAYMPLVDGAEEVINYLIILEKRLQEELSALRQTEQNLQLQAAAQLQPATGLQPVQLVNPSANPQGPLGQVRTRVHLPKLILPKFSGKVTDWPKFWNLFHVNIDNRSDLSDAEKLSYLFTLVEGDALSVIDGLSVQDDHYPIAITQLKTRYARETSTQIAAYVAEFKRIPSCGGSVQQKRNTFNQCERLFRQMEAAGQDLSDNMSLGMEYLSKFPSGMIRELDQFHNINVTRKLPDIRKKISEVIGKAEVMSETIDSLRALNPSDEQKKNERDRQPRGSQSLSTPERTKGEFWNRKYSEPPKADPQRVETSVFIASARAPTRAPAEPRRPCYLCKGGHFNSECTMYTTAQSRRKRLMELSRCTRCMGTKHYAKDCTYELRPCIACGAEHVTALCDQRFPDPKRTTPSSRPDSKPELKPRTSLHKQAGGAANVSLMSESKPKSPRGQTLLMTAWCNLANPKTGKTIAARLILDSGSSRDYITERAAKQLALEPESDENIEVKVFGSNRAVGIQSKVVNFNLALRDGSVKLIEANTTPVISDASVTPARLTPEEKSILQPFESSLADKLEDPEGHVDVLLGAANFWDIVTGSPFKSETDLKLVPSKLGILLAGTLSTPTQSENTFATFFCLDERSKTYPELSVLTPKLKPAVLPQDVDEYWKLETIGITDDPTKNDDDVAYEKFKETLIYNDNEKRYYVQWPWIEDKKALLPTNLDGAKRRFQSLAKKLSDQPSLRQRYQEVLDLQIERGIIEKVPCAEIDSPKFQTHYLPHRPVITEQKVTTKVRIVYDASARAFRGAPALNDCMYRGPVILPDLCEILIRFRARKIAIIADVEKAFLQIGLQDSERDVCRFFWFADRTTVNPEEIQVYRFCRVLFGATASPFLLGGTITSHLSSHQNLYRFAKQLTQDIFVDNAVSGVSSENEATQFYTEGKELFEKAGMNLQEWCTNSHALLEFVAEKDRVKKTDVKVLGISWDSLNDDTMRLTCSKWPEQWKCQTKRQIMKAIATIYDPLGWYQPAVLPAKILLQSLWQRKIPWDEVLSQNDRNSWQLLHSSISDIFEHRIDRYVPLDCADEAEIVAFSDASGNAYAATVYLRLKHSQTWTTHLVFAKSRLAPTNTKSQKPITLPRLELLGFTIATRAAQFVRTSISNLKANIRIHLFCDSSIVLGWLSTSKPLSVFVENRITEIRKTDNMEFHYVRTKENPADLSTRGASGSDLLSNDLWWHGPPWLRQPQSRWPQHDISSVTAEELREIEAEVRHTALLHSFLAGEPPADHRNITNVIDVTRFSKLLRLLRTTVYVLKFVRVVIWDQLPDAVKDRSKLKKSLGYINSESDVTAEDVKIASDLWVRAIQESGFPEVLEALETGKKNKLVKQLGLGLDPEGIIRSYSRFAHSGLPDDVKYPKLLPGEKDNRFVRLVVWDAHGRLYHAGESQTLSQVRREFWIPRGRSVVRHSIFCCACCSKFYAKPFARPPMPSYPEERMVRSAPFQFSGLDYFGPCNVKIGQSTTSKMWVCLFTCLSTRAIHLEWVLDCSSVEFLNALTRFISRRGVPEWIISDNAAQFRIVKQVGDHLWNKIFTNEDVMSFSANRGINWRFITELAPWQGGFYERLVGVVKSVMKKAIGRRVMWWQDFVTLITEAEAIVNSRPLTYIQSDRESIGRVIRPADFLTGLPICDPTVNLSQTAPRDLGEAGRKLAKYWKQKQKFLDHLWQIWQEEYLLSLRERSGAQHRDPRSRVQRSPVVGEVVHVKDQKMPRSAWKIARITRLLPSSDNQIRSVEVMLPNKYLIKRSVAHLYPIELSSENSELPIPVAPAVTTRQDDENEDFMGFDESDILRVTEALSRFPDDVGSESE